MFFHLSINHYAPVLIRFRFGFGTRKKEAHMKASFVALLCRYNVMVEL
jgi:hypothetical protein